MDITKNTLAMWLKATILQAYKSAGKSLPRTNNPHELRALATTMTLHQNVPVTQILKGCFWRSDSTFSNYYLRRLSMEDVQGLHKLGPLVAAQTVVNTHRSRRH